MHRRRWTREEIIIALNLYMQCCPERPGRHSPVVQEAKELLRQFQKRRGSGQSTDFRSTNSVYLKMENFHALNPDHDEGSMKHVSNLDKEMMQYYFSKPEELHKDATNILKLSKQEPDVPPPFDFDFEEPMEGMMYAAWHIRRERNKRIVKQKKEMVMDTLKKLLCESCEFDFEQSYRERGKGFIECHHKVPLSEIEVGRKTKLEDLALVCSNCHRIIHRKRPWLTVEQVRELMPR